MDKHRQVQLSKKISEQLLQIEPDKDFIKEILQAMETEEELNRLHKILSDSPHIVPAEVYDAASFITDNRFKKTMPEARILKETYLQSRDSGDLKALLSYLWGNDLVILERWDLTAEEEKRIEETELGNTVPIETPCLPALFQLKDDSVLIRIYTSELEIPRALKHKYARHMNDLQYAWFARDLIERTISKPVLLGLDIDSDEYLIQDSEWAEIIEGFDTLIND